MADQDTQITLRETIEQAVEQSEAPLDHPGDIEQNQPENNQDLSVQESAKTDRLRDESGKFAKQTQPTPSDPQQQEAAPVAKPRPSSWKKDYEEHWGKLDPQLQDYLAQREVDYAKGVSTYKQNWDNAAPIYEAMQPFMPILQEHNIAPQQWISNLGNAHKTLATGSPEEKIQMFAKLATDYGVPIGALTGGQQDPQFSMIAQELSQIKNQWSQFQAEREQQTMAEFSKTIEEFKKTAPHFDAVRSTVAELLRNNLATDLQSAYDKAVRLNDDLWQQQQAQQAQSQAQQRQAVNAEKKAKAVSPRSSSPTGMMGTTTGKKSIRDIVSEQLDAVMTGRV